MTMQFSDLAARAAADGRIEAEELLALRRGGWQDAVIDQAEADALVEANDRLEERTPEWCDFFVEALGEFVVNGEQPHGYVSDTRAGWLIAALDRDGKVETLAELELLVRVCEHALSTPDALKRYALAQLEHAVLEGEGPTREGALGPGITAAECALLRRLLFAAGGDRPASVSKAEAEMLFRLKDAALYEANAPEWQALFVQGVANFLLGFGGHEPLTAERAGQLEAFMDREGEGIGGFLGRMLTSKPDLDGFGSLLGLAGDPPDRGVEAFDDEAEAAAVLEPEESDWLSDRLEADEELDDLEKALIAFIDAETGGHFVPRPA